MKCQSRGFLIATRKQDKSVYMFLCNNCEIWKAKNLSSSIPKWNDQVASSKNMNQIPIHENKTTDEMTQQERDDFLKEISFRDKNEIEDETDL